ncbi:major capsid protein [Vibrio phage 1.123.O._10N.286.48.F3]|nr:major capsid protein [Vibrio phage 1.123.O._10N.286.48.F3]
MQLNKTITLNHLKDKDGNRLDGMDTTAFLEDWADLPDIIQNAARADGLRLDDSESTIFALQLQYLRQRILDRPYPANRARTLIPQQREAAPGAEEFAYRIFDQAGMFEIITNYSDDLPLTDIKGEKLVADIIALGGAVTYSVDEVEKSTMAGVPIVERKMSANRDIAERTFEQIAWTGKPEYNVYGLTNHPNITTITAPNGAAGTSTFASKTALEIYADLVAPIIQQDRDTNDIEKPDTIIMTAEDFEIARTKFFDDASGQSAMQRFELNYRGITIETTPYMRAAGAADTNVMIHYKRDSNKLAMETPLPYTMYPPQYRNLATVINARMKTAGVIVYFPLSVTKTEGI